jgi:hypothetical protein
MKHLWIGLFSVISTVLYSQAPTSAPSREANDVMVVGVAHDSSVMGGGISSSNLLAPGKASVQPIGWLTPAGEWKRIRCDPNQPKECKRFDREYLSKPHSYTVVSADGKGAAVQVERMTLDDECFGYGGQGIFAGGKIRYAAVAAESTEIFSSGSSAKRLPDQDAEPIRKALAAKVENKLDSTKELRVYSIELEGRSFVLIQRAYQDFASKPSYKPNGSPNFNFILAIGTMHDGRFQLLHWKENTGDDNEQILGLIHLKNGRDFLVNTTSDPEGYLFRVYGIRGGKLALIFEGGGGGC